jgi:hypothetical protein
MSRISRLALLGLIWSVAVHADDRVAGPDCSADVCVVNVLDTSLITGPCTGYTVLLAYSTTSGATLIQCNAPSSNQDNRTFVFDRLNGGAKSFEVHGGRFLRPGAWDQVEREGVRDEFGLVPLCPQTKRAAPGAGELIIVEKHPGDSDEHPYCYRVNYVVTGSNRLTLRSDEGKELTPLSQQGSEEWARLRQKLAPYSAAERASEPAKAGKAASVTSMKAVLYLTPSKTDASKMYLIKGDQVEVMDDSKLAEGWCMIRYVTKTGKAIERWALAEDLEIHK